MYDLYEHVQAQKGITEYPVSPVLRPNNSIIFIQVILLQSNFSEYILLCVQHYWSIETTLCLI